MSFLPNKKMIVPLLMLRSLLNMALTFVLASTFPVAEASMLLFVYTLATQVRGVFELNLSNFCVLRLQDGVNMRKFSVWLLIWQFVAVSAIYAAFSTYLDLKGLDTLAYSLVLFVLCNQGLWGLVYAYGSADRNFARHLFLHTLFLSATVLGLYLHPLFALQYFQAYVLLSLAYFSWVVFEFNHSKNTPTLLTVQIVLYIQPFAINSLLALIFVFLTTPLIMAILPPEEYIIYTLAIQATSIYLFLYRGINKNILANLYAKKIQNERVEKLSVLILAVGSILFIPASLDTYYFSHLLIQLGDLALNLEFLMLSSALGLVTLINLHQNNCLQAIDKNWPLLGFRLLSNSVLLATYWVFYRLTDEPVFKHIITIDFLVVLAVVILTRVYLARYWKSAV